jgi:DNA-binding response OmpR family regulator
MAAKKNPLILVVEDDRFLVKAIEAKLSTSGFDVGVARDGEDAVSFLKKKTPNLILLDLIMPKKNGFEVLEEMNGNAVWKKIPVIILSNLGQESDQQKGMELGAIDYIVKTKFSLQQIVDLLHKHLGKK